MLVYQIEALILASETPITLAKLRECLSLVESPMEPAIDNLQLHACLHELEQHYAQRGIQLIQVAGGWQFRTHPKYADVVTQLWQKNAPRLSRSMLETLAVIAYQQPTTRGEIEALRGIRVSSSVMSGLLERGWVKIIGRKDVPGRPHIYGTSQQFLSDFGLKSLNDLPDSSQLVDLQDLSFNEKITEPT